MNNSGNRKGMMQSEKPQVQTEKIIAMLIMNRIEKDTMKQPPLRRGLAITKEPSWIWDRETSGLPL